MFVLSMFRQIGDVCSFRGPENRTRDDVVRILLVGELRQVISELLCDLFWKHWKLGYRMKTK